MRRFIQSFAAWLLRCLLSLRYRIRFKGLDTVTARRGVLILPNHPGEMDPVILCSHLWPTFRPHPMAIEDFYWMPGVHGLLKLIGTVPMPNPEGRLGSYKKLRIEEALDRVAALLDAGENVLLYPSGRLMRDTVENLGAATAVSDLLRRRPGTPIAVVRSTGLLGSMFAWLSHRQRPDLGVCLKRSLKYLFLNLGLFMPRRPVSIEVALVPDEFPRQGDKMEINRWLEGWYNLYGPEQPTPVSYLFWKREYLSLAEPPAEAERPTDTTAIPEAVRETVIGHLAEVAGQQPDQLEDSHHLARDLGLDSLTLGELVAWIEETYMVLDLNVEDLHTVGDVLVAAAGQLTGTGDAHPAEAPEAWKSGPPAPSELGAIDPDRTIQEHFLEVSERLANHVALADETSGVLSWRRLRTAAILFAEVLRERPEQSIGVMLPASVGADIVTVAVLLAGKTPVMLNWTLGDTNLQHVIETAGLKVIITSGRFLDRLETLNVRQLQDVLLTLEELGREQLTLGRKLSAALLARRSAATLIARYRTNSWTPEQTAVVLFTSGSESVPKGVPLTHRNVLANLHSCVEAICLAGDDVLYGFLPPFHSFGFTATTALPLVTGLRTAYYPNPTEARKLAHGIAMWQPSIICGTPTFVAGICKAAGSGELTSMRIILTGAEKAPEDLFARLEQQAPDAHLLEGYGITETSPAITFTRPGEKRVGVGKALPGIELLIVDIDREEPVPAGQQGLILVCGPNVFGGYLGRDSKDVFREIGGKRYYVTGDLGFLDDEGNLTISGRLKRFVKIGGEMISLPAMEAAIKAKHPDEDGEPRSAIAYVDRDGERPLLGLYTTFETSLEEANGLIRDAGFSNLARLTSHEQLEAIPLLGTGKTDYRTLTARLKEQH